MLIGYRFEGFIADRADNLGVVALPGRKLMFI